MSTIALIHEGPMSLDHLGNMCITAEAVQEVVKAKGSKRRRNAKKDRFDRKPKAYPEVVAYGSKNIKKSAKWWQAQQDDYDRQLRKQAKPHRPGNHQLMLVALFGNFEGQYPFRVITPQPVSRRIDELVTEVTRRNNTDPVLVATRPVKVTVYDDEYRRFKQREARHAPKVIIDRGPITISDRILEQRPLGEAKAAPKVNAIKAERFSRGQYHLTK